MFFFVYLFAAPPAYAEVVTAEQRQNCMEVSSGREDFDGPLYAYIQEFRFQPPPPYSEVNITNKLHMTGCLCSSAIIIITVFTVWCKLTVTVGQ